MLAIEFRNNHILMVDGKVSNKKVTIKKAHQAKFDESWINQNGVVQVDAMADFIEEQLNANDFKSRNDVTVCFNLFNSIYRELRVPAVDGKKLKVLVQSEMINMLNLSHNYLIDYVVLNEEQSSEGHFVNVLAVAMPPDYFESFLKVFRGANLKVKVADVGVNALIKMMEASHYLHYNRLSVVVNLLESNIRMHLFDSFDYIFTRSVTLNSMEDFEQQVLENVNKMVQFMYTKVSVKENSKIILMGFEELSEEIREKIQKDLDISCEVYKLPAMVVNQSDGRTEQYTNAIGAMVRRG